MNYVEIEFFDTEAEKKDILIALLSEIGFDSFQESEGGLSAYIPEDAFNKNILEEEVLEKSRSLRSDSDQDPDRLKKWLEEASPDELGKYRM